MEACHNEGSHFNPRTHEECDMALLGDIDEEEYFNPRTHEECDLACCV